MRKKKHSESERVCLTCTELYVNMFAVWTHGIIVPASMKMASRPGRRTSMAVSNCTLFLLDKKYICRSFKNA